MLTLIKWILCLQLLALGACADYTVKQDPLNEVAARQNRAGVISADASQPRLLALAAKADLAYARGHWIDATTQYQRWISLEPQQPYAWFRLGNSLAKQGSLKQAISAYESSLQHRPSQSKPWQNLSMIYLHYAHEALRHALTYSDIKNPDTLQRELQLDQLGKLLRRTVPDDSNYKP